MTAAQADKRVTVTITAPGVGTTSEVAFPGDPEGQVVRLFVDGMPAGTMFQPRGESKVQITGILARFAADLPDGSFNQRWEWLVRAIRERWNELGIGELDELIVA